MKGVKVVFAEIVGLFVDDGRLAVAILVWLAVTSLLFPHLSLPPAWTGLILFAGLAVILVESAVRRSRR